MVMNDRLSQNLFGLTFKNPVIAASGTFGWGTSFTDFYRVDALGGFVTKSVTLEPRTGNKPPRIIETPSGMLNAIGLQNDGLDHFLKEIEPSLRTCGTNVMVNVAGRTIDDYTFVTEKLSRCSAVSALEINISCPNVREGGIAFGSNAQAAANVTEAVKKVAAKPVIMKLSPNVTDITEIARAVEDSGADAVSLINTLTGMVIDVESRRSMLANITGGLSGPAIRPVAVRMVYQVAKTVKIPVIGIGGIISARDALEFLIAGASLIETGCGMFVEPMLPLNVIEGIQQYMDHHKIAHISEIIGSIIVP
jgi:dihydroorotate dehydrogenase (NAD+) catalytic subunit